MEMTKMGERGQVVLPKQIREEMKLQKGERFIVMQQENSIVLQQIVLPSEEEFEKMLQKGRERAKRMGLKPEDVPKLIKQVREQS